MNFLKKLLLLLCFFVYTPLCVAVDDPAAANPDDDFTNFDFSSVDPGDLNSFEQPVAPTTVVVPPAPPAAGVEPFPIELPLFGTLDLYPYQDSKTGKKGLKVNMPSSGTLLSMGPLLINNGAFVLIDSKLMYGADATLFGFGVRVALRSISDGEPVIVHEHDKDIKGISYKKVTLGVDFFPGQTVTFEVIPGARFTVLSADIVLEKTKSTQLVVGTTIANKQANFTFILGKTETDAIAAIPPMALKDLIPEVMGTPVENAQLIDISLTINNFLSKTTPPKKRLVTLHGKADFSGVPGLTDASAAKTMDIKGNYDPEGGSYSFDASAKDISLAGIGVLHNAELAIHFKREKDAKKTDPLTKTVKLNGSMDVDAGIGKFTVEVDADVTKKGIEFSAEMKQGVSFNGITLSNPHITYSSATKTFSVAGEADILGQQTMLSLGKDKNGNISAAASLGDSLKPFGFLPSSVPIFPSLTLKNPSLSIQQSGKGDTANKTIAITGTVNIFGKDTGIIVYSSALSGGAPQVTAVIDIPGSVSITDITKNFGPIGTMFDHISALMAITLNQAKFVVSNQTVKDLPNVGPVAAGIGITGNVTLGGVVGKTLAPFGVRGGLTGDIFMPLNPEDVDKVHVGISKPINSSFAHDFIKFSNLSFFVQGAKLPKTPQVGIDIAALIQGNQLDLQGSFEETGALDISGQYTGAISFEKIGFPLSVDRPLIELHTLDGEPTGAGLAGDMKFGNAKGKIYADLDLKDPIKSVIQFSDVNICITDTYNLWLAMAQKTARTGTTMSLPKILCLEDVAGQWALAIVTKKNCAKDCTILPGIALSGKLNLGIPTIPKGVVNLGITKSGIEASGALESNINLGGVIKISAADPCDKKANPKCAPSLGLHVSDDEQKVWIDGMVDLTVIKQSTKMYISPAGMTLNGKMTVTLPQIGSADLDIIIDTQKQEASGIGKLSKMINVGGVIKISDASGNNPPSIGISVSAQEQKMWIDGYVNFAGIAKEQTKIYISPQNLSFDLLTEYLGVRSSLIGDLPITHPQDGTAEYKLDLTRLNDYVKNDLSSQVSVAKQQVSKYLGMANDAISGAEDKCGSIPGLSDICKAPMLTVQGLLSGLKSAVNGAMTGIDKIATSIVKEFHFNAVSLKGDIAAFKGSGSPVSVTFAFFILGKDVGPITISMPNPQQIGDLGKTLGNTIYDQAIKPAVNALVQQAEDVYNNMMSVINGIGGGFEKAYETLKNAGETAYNETKKGAILVGNKIADAGKTAGNEIADTGKKAGNAIADTGKKAISGIKDAGESIGSAFSSAFGGGHHESIQDQLLTKLQFGDLPGFIDLMTSEGYIDLKTFKKAQWSTVSKVVDFALEIAVRLGRLDFINEILHRGWNASQEEMKAAIQEAQQNNRPDIATAIQKVQGAQEKAIQDRSLWALGEARKEEQNWIKMVGQAQNK